MQQITHLPPVFGRLLPPAKKLDRHLNGLMTYSLSTKRRQQYCVNEIVQVLKCQSLEEIKKVPLSDGLVT